MSNVSLISRSPFFVFSEEFCLSPCSFPGSVRLHPLIDTRKEMLSRSRFAIESLSSSICNYGFGNFSRFSKVLFASSFGIDTFHLIGSHFLQMRIPLSFVHWFFGHDNKINTVYKIFFYQDNEMKEVPA